MSNSKLSTNLTIQNLITKFERLSETQLGYPINLKFDYSPLLPFFKYHINNAGDPFDYLNLQLNTKEIEQEVIDFFANIYGGTKKECIWGYVTNGGTEGNLYGLFLAKQKYNDGVLYFSKETHYSIKKIARILGFEFEEVNSQNNGEIDYEDLKNRILNHKNKPVVMNLNYGTTVKGGIDDHKMIIRMLKQLEISDYYIHVDAALFGMLLPFIENAPKLSIGEDLKGVSSIAISGHKFLGSPFACGVVLTRKQTMECTKNKIEYLDSLDTTITGSRNGHAPLIIWYAIRKRGIAGFTKEAKSCLKLAEYLHKSLLKAGIESNLNDFSNTVYFAKPSIEIIKKWQLATQGKYAHVVVMQHLTKKIIDKFLLDIKKDQSISTKI